MTIEIKELVLDESYEFDVIVDPSGVPYSGKLTLSPKEIKLVISGDETKDRVCQVGYRDVKKLVCKDINKTFVLHDLKISSWRSSTVSHYPENIGHIEIAFDVGYLVFIPTDHYNDNSFSRIEIHSKTLHKWIDSTKTQQKIIDNHAKGDPFKDLVEFICEIKDFGLVGVCYNTNIHYSLPDFSSGIVFPPVVFIEFFENTCSGYINEIYERVYFLFSLIVGDELDIEKIIISYEGSAFNLDAMLYYPLLKTPKRKKRSNILFPLSRDLCWDQMTLPDFPLDVFDKYMSLNDLEVGYWTKYVKYRRMENVEERFLGYFRLLESLVFKKKSFLDEEKLIAVIKKSEGFLIKAFNDKKNVKSFLRGLLRYNNSKYNTEKNIQDYLKTIPSELRHEWSFSSKSVGEICKLRNDITHANNYYSSELEMEKKAKFIEVILVFSIFEMVGVCPSVLCKVIDRLDGYYLIKR